MVEGRLDEAMGRLEDARATFQQAGAADETPPVDVRIAECDVYLGRTQAALDRVATMLALAPSSRAVAKIESLLHRVRAMALLCEGQRDDARTAAEASLGVARSHKDFYQVAMSLLLLNDIDRDQGAAPSPARMQEAEALIAKFSVRRVPHLPTPTR